jgi:hypothetical protein
MRCLFMAIFSLFVVSLVYAQSNQSETLTITTYYPSPYGVYRNLRLSPSDEPQGSAVQPGVMYFNRTDKNIYIYKGPSDGGWQIMGGGGSSQEVNMTVQVEKAAFCVYKTLNSCPCPTTFSSSPGPIPAGAKVKSCSTPDWWDCSFGVGGQYGATCSATISGNTINVVINPPPVPITNCELRAANTVCPFPSCNGPSLCQSMYPSATVKYSY